MPPLDQSDRQHEQNQGKARNRVHHAVRDELDLLEGHLDSPAGSVSVDAAATNFFEARNLITAAGGALDENFSVIQSDGSGGAFISTNTADFTTVIPQDGTNDVLAEIVFDVSADAIGVFTFALGPGTALSDGDGFPVAFSGPPLTITVVHAPGVAAAFAATALVWTRRRR